MPGNIPRPASRRVLPTDLLHKLLSSRENWAGRKSLPRNSRPMGAWRLPLQSSQHSDFLGCLQIPRYGRAFGDAKLLCEAAVTRESKQQDADEDYAK
jgi:hypothetical protein